MHHGMQGPYFPKRGAAAKQWVQDLDRELSRRVFALHTRGPGSVLSTTENKQKPTQIIWPSMVLHTLISAFRRPRKKTAINSRLVGCTQSVLVQLGLQSRTLLF